MMHRPGQSAVLGRVFDIQRFSVHDGPGIRTTVFLQGCPLRCVWCHNPEGIASGPMLSFLARKCIACGACVDACERHAHRIEGGRHDLDRAICAVCGACADVCYAGSLELVGRMVTADEVLAVVLRDRPFYENSGGGMTLSGGEPLAQIDFAEALLRGGRGTGLHCCVETCGHVPFEDIERIRPLVDVFLYDIKDTRDAEHRLETGVTNAQILANLRRLHASGAAIRLRLPLVPGMNDSVECLDGIADLWHSLPGLEGAEIMPYHRLGESKRERLGIARPASPGREASAEAGQIEHWKQELRNRGVQLIAEESALRN